MSETGWRKRPTPEIPFGGPALIGPARKRRRIEKTSPSEKAEQLSLHDPFNADSWFQLIREIARPKNANIEQVRGVLERFLKIFPTAPLQYKFLVDQEMQHRNYDRVEKIFSKCLPDCLDVRLYRSYLEFVKGKLQHSTQYNNYVDMSYKFALDKVGEDLEAMPLWREYISFLKHRESGDETPYERMESIRRGYIRGFLMPIEGADELFKEYQAWENLNNQSTGPGSAQALINQFRPSYLVAHNTFLERKRLHHKIMKLVLATPKTGNLHAQDRNYDQVAHWSALIEFEFGNPQKLRENEHKRRMIFTFKQALMTLRYYPDVWMRYAEYVMESGVPIPANKVGSTDTAAFNSEDNRIEEASKIYEEAIRALPDCELLYFTYAEFLEKHGRIPKAGDVYKKLLSAKASPLAHIQNLLFIRRTQTQNDARKAFISVLKSDEYTFHVNLAAALMEYHINNEPAAANKLFQLGLQNFGDSPQFVLRYIDFLSNQSDSQNLWVTFERTLPKLDTEHPLTRQIWERYINFQKRLLDLEKLEEAEKRRNTALSANSVEQMLFKIERFSFMDLVPCSNEYRDTLKRSVASTKSKMNAKIVTSGGSVGALKKGSEKGSSSNTNVVPRVFANAPKLRDVGEIVRPDVKQLVAFVPGIRFLQPVDGAVDSGALFSTQQMMSTLPPKLASLLAKLPPPHVTQLVKLTIGMQPLVVDADKMVDFLKALNLAPI